jgi:iron complex outermembrane receptor protein
MTLRGMLRLSTALGALGSCALGAHAAMAADAPASQPSAAVEEVVVTATKRSENVQSVPLSVYVATKATLDRANVRDFDDVTAIAPDLTITKTTQPFNNSINIRGVGTYAFSIATEASTAVVIDDVPQAFQAEAFNALTDASQVEVLRGPQSTLFGRSASAGVISINTLAPTATFEAGARAMITGDHEQRANAFLSGPIGDQFKFRIAMGEDNYRGSLFNVFNNTWIDGHADSNIRAKLVWNPDPSWTVSLLPYWDNTHSTCCTMTPYFLTQVPGGLTYGKFTSSTFAASQANILNGIVPGPHNRQISEDVNPAGNAVDDGAGFKIEHRLGDYTLLSITSYDTYFLHDLQDTDLTSYNWGPGGPHPVPGAVAGGSANGGEFKTSSVTQEFRLTSPSSGRFRYVTGLFFSKTDGEASFVRGTNTLQQDGTLLTVPPTTSAYSSYLSRSTDTNYALYGQSTFDITHRIGLVTGLRFNRDDLNYSFHDNFNNVTYGDPTCSTTSPSGLKIKTCNTYDSVTGKVALEYHVTPNIMLFAGYDAGNKGPAFDLTSSLTTRTPIAAGAPLAGYPTADAIASRQPVPPETVGAYQFGFKSSFFDRRLIWNVTAFNEVYHNFQVQTKDPNTNISELNSVGQVTTQGVETELFVTPARNFTLNLAAAYDDAIINRFLNAACFSGQTAVLGCVGSAQNLINRPLFNAPKYTVSGNAQYDVPLQGDYNLFFTGSFRWQSAVYYSLVLDPDSYQRAYGIVDLGAGLTKGSWKVSLFVNNVFNQNYATFLGRAGNWNINPYGATAGKPISDAINWTPGRESQRYVGFQLNFNY